MAGKRANGEGALRQRGDGRWEMIFMHGFSAGGKPKRHSIYGKTQKEVLDKAAQFKLDLEKDNIFKSNMRFDEWADLWYEQYKGSVREPTYEGYKYTVKQLKRLMENKLLRDI